MPPKISTKKKKSFPKKTKSAQADKNNVVNEGEKCMETLESVVEAPKASIVKDSGNEVNRPLANTEIAEVVAKDTSVEEILEEPASSKPNDGEDKIESESQANEKVATAKLERSRRVKEFRKELLEVQRLTEDFEAKPEQVNMRMDMCEETFHKLVSSHEKYMQCEDNIEKRDLMIENYNDQRDVKIQLDYTVELWMKNREKYGETSSELGHSLRSARSRYSTATSRSSAKEKRRLVEEAKLKIQTLREKQELERQLEVTEQSKTELRRKLKLLNAEAELKHAKIHYVIDQIPDDAGIDGMNAYLEGNLDKIEVEKSQMVHPAPESPRATDSQELPML
jgi:hypothetical protein